MKTSVRAKHDSNSDHPFVTVESYLDGDYFVLTRKVPHDTGFNFDVIAFDGEGIDNLIEVLTDMRKRSA